MTDLAYPAATELAETLPSPESTATETACGVCGNHALAEGTVHEFAGNLGTRLICQVCGAHRVT